MRAKDIPANAPANAVVAMGRTDCLFYQPLSHMGLKQGAQAFTGASTTRPNTYPHVNAACDLTDKIGVTKSALNLKQLENITEHTYSDAVASTSKIVEVEESPKLLERFTYLKLSDKEAKANHQREKCRKLRLEKKFAKSLEKGKGKAKESVHPEPINPDAGNCKGTPFSTTFSDFDGISPPCNSGHIPSLKHFVCPPTPSTTPQPNSEHISVTTFVCKLSPNPGLRLADALPDTSNLDLEM